MGKTFTMNNTRFGICLSFCAVLSAVHADKPPTVGEGQLGVPISWHDCGDEPGSVCMLQKTRDNVLYLTPNESFFPERGLVAAGQGQVPDLRESQ